MNPGYTAEQTARLVGALRWACGRLSEIVDAWAREAAAAAAGTGAGGLAPDPDRSPAPGVAAAAVRMAELSRRLASHRDALDELQPDSERLVSWRPAAPADPSLGAALDEIAALQGPLERLAVVRQVLVPQLLGAYRDICDHAAPHCDAALASAARSLHHDLDRGCQDDGAPAEAGGHQPGALAAAERSLSAAGGIVGRALVRPGVWA